MKVTTTNLRRSNFFGTRRFLSIILLCFFIFFGNIYSQTLRVYSTIPGRTASDKFSAKVRKAGTNDVWQTAFVQKTISKFNPKWDSGDESKSTGYYQNLYNYTSSWIAVEFEGMSIEVEITYLNVNITEAKVRPEASPTSTAVANNKVIVTINSPCNLSVDVNGQMEKTYTGDSYNENGTQPVHSFHIFANPVYNYPTVDGTNVILVNPSTPINPDPTKRPDGKTYVFAPGVHVMGTNMGTTSYQPFIVKSNEKFYIPGNAVVEGAIHPKDDRTSINWSVIGSGAISSERMVRDPKQADGGISYNKTFTNATSGILLEGFVVVDAANHTFNMSAIKVNNTLNIYRNVKTLGWRENSDAINAFGNSVVTDCFFRCQDDAFYYGDNVKISNCVVWNDYNGAVVFLPRGTDVFDASYIKDITVIYQRKKNQSGSGGRVISMRNTPDGAVIKNIQIRNVLIEDPLPSYGPFIFEAEGTGSITMSNVIFENIRQTARAQVYVNEPAVPENLIIGKFNNITFKDIWYYDHYMTSFTNANDWNTDRTGVVTSSIVFQVSNLKPVAAFTGSPTTLNKGNSVTFTDQSTNAPTSWSWSFPGGTPSTSNLKNPVVTYAAVGTYSVTLTASNTVGSSTPLTKTNYITVLDIQNEALPWNEDFTKANGTTSDVAPTSWTATGGMSVQNNEISFNTTTTEGVLTTGVIDMSSGPVTVSVNVRGGGGLDVGSDYLKLFKKVDGGAEEQIDWANGLVTVSSWTADITSGSTLQLVLRAKVSATSEYYFFDNLKVISKTPPPTYTITTSANPAAGGSVTGAGTYNEGTSVNVCATENSAYIFTGWTINGVTTNTSVKCTTLVTSQNYTVVAQFVAGQAPVANFSVPTNACVGAPVTFTDQSTNSATSWSWTLNGATPSTSTAQNPTVTYAAAGTYNITLTATNSYGSNSITKPITVISCGGDVTAITNWVSGTNNVKAVGSNRMMVVMAMGESTAAFSASSATYGGQAMTRVTDKAITNGSTTYSAIFILKEAGVNLANSGTINVVWSATPSAGFSIYSVMLANVDQTTAIAKAYNGIANATTISTTALAAASGDMVVMCGATANNNIASVNNGFIEKNESNSTWGDGVTGMKMGTGVNETPSFTQSASGRMTICAIVAKKSTALKSGTTEGINKQVENIVNVYPNPVASILNISLPDSETAKEIRVYNAVGQLAYSVSTNETSTQIDVQSLNLKGIVMVQVVSDNVSSIYKVLVK